MYGVAAVAAMSGALADAAVVPSEPLAALLRAAFGFSMVLAGSRARRWTWLVLAGVGVLVAADLVWLVVAAAGLGVGVASSVLPRRRINGALSVALSLQGLFHMVIIDDAFVAAFVVVLGSAPLLVSAYLVSPRRVRRVVHRVGFVIGLVVVVAAVAAVAASVLGYSDALEGSRSARSGLEAVRSGETSEAAADFRRAASSFERAESLFGGPWLWPAKVVPGLAQQVEAVEVLSAQGAAVSQASRSVAELVDYDQLRYEDGQIDLTTVREVQQPLEAAASTMTTAADEVAVLRDTVLVRPLADAVDDFSAELDRAVPEAEVAAATAAVAPAMLGAEGTRRYAVLFTTPAELRGLGGFIGSWSILEAVDGRVELVDTLRSAELNERARAAGLELSVPETVDEATARRLTDYLYRYQRFEPARYLQDISFSPDLPTVGAVAHELLPGAGIGELDGVIVADPYGLAALLELTGPVTVEGHDGQIDADGVVDFLLRDQYSAFDDRAERVDFLGEVGAATFDALVTGSLPPPDEIADVLGPVLAEGRLAMWSVHGQEQEVLDRIGASLAFPDPGGADLLSVRTQNKGNNKIDVFQRREVEHEVSFDPGTGRVDATISVTLHNDAPAWGLPDAVIGSNDQGLPLGTSVVYLSVYTPFALEAAALDGERIGVEFHRELGVSVYSRYIEIGPGGSATLQVQVTGRLEGPRYALLVVPQPTVGGDDYRIGLEPTERWRIADTSSVGPIGFGQSPDATRAMGVGLIRRPVGVEVEFSPR